MVCLFRSLLPLRQLRGQLVGQIQIGIDILRIIMIVEIFDQAQYLAPVSASASIGVRGSWVSSAVSVMIFCD